MVIGVVHMIQVVHKSYTALIRFKKESYTFPDMNAWKFSSSNSAIILFSA